MKNTRSLLATTLGVLTIALAATNPAYADKPTKVEVRGNQGCHLFFDGSNHSNPSDMFRHIRENSEEFVGDPNQNIVDWLSNFPEYQGNVGSLIKRNCKEFVIDIG